MRKTFLGMLVFFRCLLHPIFYLHFFMVDVHVLEISLFSSGFFSDEIACEKIYYSL
jgi:hypothetical protein